MRLRRSADLGDVMLHHLQIVQAAERLLDFSERAYDGGRRGRAALIGKLHRIPQLLGGDAYAVQRFGSVDLTRLLDCGSKTPCSLRDARGQRGSPVVIGRRATERVTHRREPVGELVDVDVPEALVHDGATLFPGFDDVRANIGERGTRDARLVRQLVDQVQRDVEFPHRTQGARETPHLPSRLAGLAAVQPIREDRQRFAQTPRRHTRLVHAGAVPFDGRRQMALERTCAAFEKTH